MPAEWNNGLFGCFGNCTICICTWFIPCYVAGKVAEKVGDNCCLCGLVLFVPILGLVCRTMIRQKVREQKGIPGGIVTDFLASWCCPACAICQEAQEVSALDMAQSMAQEIDRE